MTVGTGLIMTEKKPMPVKKLCYGKATVTVWFRFDDTKNPHAGEWLKEIIDIVDEQDNVEEVTIRKLESYNVELDKWEEVDKK